jgi:hypothetical protein
MMSNRLLVERLEALAHLEIDAILAVERALAGEREAGAKALLEAFKQERERHLAATNHLLFNHGGKAPELRADFKGYLLEGAAVALGIAGMVATATVLANGYRAQPLAPFPADVRRVVGAARDDATKQLATMKAVLKERLAHSLPWTGGSRDSEAHA